MTATGGRPCALEGGIPAESKALIEGAVVLCQSLKLGFTVLKLGFTVIPAQAGMT